MQEIHERLTKALDNQGSPPLNFWLNDLEMNVFYIAQTIGLNGFLKKWSSRLNGRQVDRLCNNLGLSGADSLKQRKQVLSDNDDLLLQYHLVEQFGKGKAQVAIAEYAANELGEEVIESCKINQTDYDRTALLFALYNKKPTSLQTVFHLDKIHRAGFAKMVLKEKVKKPKSQLIDFLQKDTVTSIIDDFDKTKKDFRISNFKELYPYNGHYLLFIRRGGHQSHIIQADNIIHGFDPEWLILEFEKDAKRVKIATKTAKLSLALANKFASGFFGMPCTYKVDKQVTYEQQIREFIECLMQEKEEEMILIGLGLKKTPLDGGSPLIWPGKKSIIEDIKHFERVVGPIFEVLEHVDHFLLLYKSKKIQIKFEKLDASPNAFILRYTDSKLDTHQRIDFEKHMNDTYEIPILPTEKRI